MEEKIISELVKRCGGRVFISNKQLRDARINIWYADSGIFVTTDGSRVYCDRCDRLMQTNVCTCGWSLDKDI